jgi:hypothetical protein
MLSSGVLAAAIAAALMLRFAMDLFDISSTPLTQPFTDISVIAKIANLFPCQNRFGQFGCDTFPILPRLVFSAGQDYAFVCSIACRFHNSIDRL